MAFVSMTRFRLRRLRFLPAVMRELGITNAQVRRAPGFLGGQLRADRRFAFWTLTLWRDAAAMRAYMTTGPHRTAMPKLLEWGSEASVAHWEADALPSWPEAERRLRAEGRPSKVRHPNRFHAGQTYPSVRLAIGGPVMPEPLP